jgi:hypothetical protein
VISKLTFDRLDFDRIGSPGTQLSYGCVVEVAGYDSAIEAGGMAGPGEAERSNPEFAADVDVGQLIALAGGASGWFHDSARSVVGTAAGKIEPLEPRASLTGSVSVFLVVTPSVSESHMPPIPSDRAKAAVRTSDEGLLVSDESTGTVRVRVN